MDIDLDFGDRDQVLSKIKYIPAAIMREGKLSKHVSGVYVNDMPVNSLSNTAAIDYITAENLGYVKIDLLNVGLYKQITSPEQLDQLMSQEPDWSRLQDPTFFGQLIHIGKHYSTMKRMPEPIDSVVKLAMFLAIIRPAKRHLIGLPWKQVAKTVWEKSSDGTYAFKQAHGISYAHLVLVNMNLLDFSNKENTTPFTLL
jgi:hypothetical protein